MAVTCKAEVGSDSREVGARIFEPLQHAADANVEPESVKGHPGLFAKYAAQVKCRGTKFSGEGGDAEMLVKRFENHSTRTLTEIAVGIIRSRMRHGPSRGGPRNNLRDKADDRFLSLEVVHRTALESREKRALGQIQLCVYWRKLRLERALGPIVGVWIQRARNLKRDVARYAEPV